MTENEAKIFIQNAMEQSRNVLAELMLIMPKVFAAKRKSLGEYYSNLENCKKEIQSCEVAIKALEEVQRWRTSVINPNIKNEFANTSTQICHNCDHKDEYIEELEAEVEPYRTIEKDLKERYHANVDIPLLMHHFIETVFEGEKHEGFCLLTNEDREAWEEYKAIGTPEECLAWKEKQTAKKIVRREATDEDIENELREFITRKGMIFQCPTCGCYIAVDGMKNCWDCGQKLDWSDEQ